MENQIYIFLSSERQSKVEGPIRALAVAQNILENIGFPPEDFYIIHNGKKLHGEQIIENGSVHIVPRLNGGKGGFGSMLRAIGAQIEKTTNREACRDLSGRRLRDINEEKRLKTWITQQADREREAAERKRLRLERLMAEPKLEFKDPEYEAARAQMTEKVYDAVEHGIKAASSSQPGPSKRPSSSITSSEPPKKKKRTCLWLGSEDEDISSSADTDDSDKEDVTGGAQAKAVDTETDTTKKTTAATEVKDKSENTASATEEILDKAENVSV